MRHNFSAELPFHFFRSVLLPLGHDEVLLEQADVVAIILGGKVRAILTDN
jgi:hypothetical protein